MLSLAVWYMSISEMLGTLISLVAITSSVVGIIMCICSLVAAMDGQRAFPPIVWKIWGIVAVVSVSLSVLLPTDRGHVAYLINSNVAIAEAEGRPIPKLNAEEQSLINALAVMYVTKTHKAYVHSSQEKKK